jgi:hypothetical protein
MNEVQANLKSTLQSRLMVSDLTPYAYSIYQPMLTSSHSSLPYDPTAGYESTPGYDPTPGMPLNHVHPLRITLERFLLLHFKHNIFILNALNLWLPAHPKFHVSDSTLLGAGADDPARPQLLFESMFDSYVKATT